MVRIVKENGIVYKVEEETYFGSLSIIKTPIGEYDEKEIEKKPKKKFDEKKKEDE